MPDRDVRQRILCAAKSIVVKVGTNGICDEAGRPDRKALSALVAQVAALRNDGVTVTLVASGAIGAGVGELGWPARPKAMPDLQAAAAVGQGQLMRQFHDAFARRQLRVGQVLVTRDDFEDRTRYLNIRNTLRALDAAGVVPIINENDTVAVDEIRFGENDVLAALVASVTDTDALILLTSTAGVIGRDGEVLDVIEKVDEGALALDNGARSARGSGGMTTKLQAAGMVTRAGEVAVIADARQPKILHRVLAGERVGTVVLPARRRMSSRRRWIGQASRPTGKIVVDSGAAAALSRRGKSLLPSGITGLVGRFAKGATVAVLDPDGREIARGLTNYSAEQIEHIRGLKTSQIAVALGDKPYDEVIHRDNLMLR